MTESLPITITPEASLIELFPKLLSILNKLEAQLNFQSLTAGWYGDEEHILSINLAVLLPESFEQQSKQLMNCEYPADDVAINREGLTINLLIAITIKEQELLTTQPKLLQKLIQLKLIKATNVIADKQQLQPLPE